MMSLIIRFRKWLSQAITTGDHSRAAGFWAALLYRGGRAYGLVAPELFTPHCAPVALRDISNAGGENGTRSSGVLEEVKSIY